MDDLAGPEVREIADMVRAYDMALGRRRKLLPIRLPGVVGRAYRAGDNLADDPVVRGEVTWEEFLARAKTRISYEREPPKERPVVHDESGRRVPARQRQ